jgi:hypothetical protein
VSEKDDNGVAGDAKGVAGDFIQSLGLLELILGGVGLYALWLWYGEQTSRLFPSTGTKFLDIGLLAFAAALVGKLVCLIVAAGMGLMRKLIKAADLLGYYKNLQSGLFRYLEVSTISDLAIKLGQEKSDVIELSLYYVVRADPKQQAYFDRLQTKTIVAYSTCVLSILYLPYLLRAGAPWSMILLVLFGSGLFFFLGCAEQHDYLKTLSERLIGIQTAKKQYEQTDHQSGVTGP